MGFAKYLCWILSGADRDEKNSQRLYSGWVSRDDGPHQEPYHSSYTFRWGRRKQASRFTRKRIMGHAGNL